MRHLACALHEIKLATAGDTMSFDGYGAVFGNVDAYGDVIAPGAFAGFLADAKSGKQPWPAMLSQHGGYGMGADDMTPVGIWTELSEDGTGLKVSGQFADTPRGRELHTLMKMSPRPAIDGLSIGYIAKEWEPRSKPEDPRRTLKRIDLMEISPVTFPANRLARVGSVKSLEDLTVLSEIEDYLREVGGFSRNEAKGLIARIKSASPREAEADMKQITDLLARNTHILKGK
ncbi:MAG: HK97 family phage prohead protease [Georgfuchsia sp.]